MVLSSVPGNYARGSDVHDLDGGRSKVLRQVPFIRENIDELIDQDRFKWFPEIEDGTKKWYNVMERLSQKIGTQRNELWDCQSKLRTEVSKNREIVMILKTERKEHREIVSALTAKIDNLEFQLGLRAHSVPKTEQALASEQAMAPEQVMASSKSTQSSNNAPLPKHVDTPNDAESREEGLKSQVAEVKAELSKLLEQLSKMNSKESDSQQVESEPQTAKLLYMAQAAEMKTYMEQLKNENSELKAKYDDLRVLLEQRLVQPSSKQSSEDALSQVPELSPSLSDPELIDSGSSNSEVTLETPLPHQQSSINRSSSIASSFSKPFTSTPSLRKIRRGATEPSNSNLQMLDNLYKKLSRNKISDVEQARYEEIYKQSSQAFAERPQLKTNTELLARDLLGTSASKHHSTLTKIKNELVN